MVPSWNPNCHSSVSMSRCPSGRLTLDTTQNMQHSQPYVRFSALFSSEPYKKPTLLLLTCISCRHNHHNHLTTATPNSNFSDKVPPISIFISETSLINTKRCNAKAKNKKQNCQHTQRPAARPLPPLPLTQPDFVFPDVQ